MNTEEFLRVMRKGGCVVKAGSERHKMMHELSQEALKITAEMNSGYHTPEELRAFMEQLTGKPVDNGFGLFPPFYSECGKNIFSAKTFL